MKRIDNSMVITRGKGGGGGGEGERGINGDGRRLDVGGEHTLQCTDDVKPNCAPETCIILLSNVTLINSMKRRKQRAEFLIFLYHDHPQVYNLALFYPTSNVL